MHSIIWLKIYNSTCEDNSSYGWIPTLFTVIIQPFNKGLTDDTFHIKCACLIVSLSGLSCCASLRTRGRFDPSVRKHATSQAIYLPWHSAFVSAPCSESHPLLRLSVYMAVYCGLAREKQRKTAAQMKQKQQITQSITQWQCAYLKCCQYGGVHVAESKMLITSRHFWENYITCTRCEHLSSSDIIKKYSTSYKTFLNWKHSQF